MAFRFCAILLLIALSAVSCLNMAKPNGDPDIVSMMNHVTLMDQMINSLQTQVQTSTTELTTVKDKLKTTENELQSSKDEITAVQNKLRLAETDIALLKQNQQKRPDQVEFATLKTELESLKISHNSLVQQINFTVIDSVEAGVRSNMREIQSLHSELLTTTLDLNKTTAAFETRGVEVGNLASQMQNMKKTLNQTNRDIESNKADIVSQKPLIHSTSATLHLMVTKLSAMESEYNMVQFRQNITDQDLATNRELLQSTEANVNVMQARVRTVSDNLNDLHGNLSDVRTKTEADYNAMQAQLNMTEQDLTATKALVQSISADEKAVMSQVNTITGDVNSIRQGLSVINGKTDWDVAFQVTQKGTPRSGWTTLKFDTVDYNTGNGYNKASGMFTAPVSGTYIFWVNALYSHPNISHYLYIHKGQRRLATGYFKKANDDDYGAISSMTVTHLAKGEQVHFTTGSANDMINGHGLSSYGGGLLHAT